MQFSSVQFSSSATNPALYYTCDTSAFIAVTSCDVESTVNIVKVTYYTGGGGNVRESGEAASVWGRYPGADPGADVWGRYVCGGGRFSGKSKRPDKYPRQLSETANAQRRLLTGVSVGDKIFGVVRHNICLRECVNSSYKKCACLPLLFTFEVALHL